MKNNTAIRGSACSGQRYCYAPVPGHRKQATGGMEGGRGGGGNCPIFPQPQPECPLYSALLLPRLPSRSCLPVYAPEMSSGVTPLAT